MVMFLAKIAVFAIIYFIILRPMQAAFVFTRPPRFRISLRTPADAGLHYEDVTLTARDGVPLAGWYIPSQNGAAILLLHGHGGNRLAVMAHAEALAQAGYGILMLDLRRHGSSGGRAFSRGELERDDVLTAVTYLHHRPDITPGGIGVFGVSVGGLFALHAAAHTVAIRAIATDGASPATLDDFPAPRRVIDRFLNWPLQRYYMTMIIHFTRQRPLPTTLSILPKLSQPTLYISTGQGIEQRIIQRFYEATPEPKTIWHIPHSSHASGWLTYPDEYGQRLVHFFDHALAHKEGDDWALPDLTTLSPPPPTPENDDDVNDVAYDATLSMSTANTVALLTMPLIVTLLGAPFWLLWGATIPAQLAALPSVWQLLLTFAGAIVLHELLHAVGFVIVGGVPGTAVKFGFSWKGLAPYAHCRIPIDIRAYRIATALPGLLLGLLPGAWGVINGSLLLTLFGTLMLIAAGGDFAVLLAIRRVPTHSLVQDHPSLAGCQVLDVKREA